MYYCLLYYCANFHLNPKGPVVIYIDDAEKIFVGGKKVAKDGPQRIKKDLITYVKAMSPHDNVIIIGNSREPYNCDSQKEMREVFDKFLYIPWPDYSSRVKLWKHILTSALGKVRMLLQCDATYLSSLILHITSIQTTIDSI